MPEEIQLDNRPFAEDLEDVLTDPAASPHAKDEPETTEEPKAEASPETEDAPEDSDDTDEEGFPKSDPEPEEESEDEPEAKEDKSKEKPKEDKKPESEGIKNLRNQYTKVKEENQRLQQEIQKLRETPKADDTVIKELESTRAKLAAIDFRESDEYKALDEEITVAFERGKKAALDFEVEQDDGNLRKVTESEWEAFVQASDGRAAKMGKELFGDAAGIMYQKRQKVLDTYEKAALAQKKHKDNWKEYQTKEQVESQKALKELTSATEAAIRSHQESYPAFYAIEPDDKTRKALEVGDALAKQVLNGAPELNQEQRAKVFASAYLRVKNFAALAVKLTEAEKQLKARDAELAKLKSGSPKSGQTAKTQKSGRPSIEDDILAIAEERRI